MATLRPDTEPGRRQIYTETGYRAGQKVQIYTETGYRAGQSGAISRRAVRWTAEYTSVR